MEPQQPKNEINEAMARLAQTREAAEEAAVSVTEVNHTQMSKRRLFSVTVGGNGELQEITFNGEGYRSLAPKELAALIVETVQEGRKEAQARAQEELERIWPDAGRSFELLTSMSGLDDMMTGLLRQAAGPELTEEEFAELEKSWRLDG